MARTLRVPLRPLVRGETELDEATSRYVSRVHRLRAGDTFVAFDPEAGTDAHAEVLGIGPRGGSPVRVQVGEVRPSELARSSGVTLLAGLGKGDKPEQVLRDATALGADRIVLVETSRTVVRDLGAGRRRRLEAVVVDAARQSGRGNLPAFDGPLPLATVLAALSLSGNAARVCLAPGAERTLSEVVLASRERPLTLLVGPEGGLSPEEIEAARSCGFVPASLFGFVLRTETAAVAALAAALALRGTLLPAS